MSKGSYQIGEVSSETGVSIDTIRYYEKEGLLKQPLRSEGGFRKYPRETVERIRFIRKAQSFGLTLAEIRGIMRESEKGLEKCCGHVNKVLARKLVELESKIKELQGMKKGLKTLIKTWVPLKEAKARSYSVCPQFEKPPRKTSRRRKK